MEPLSFDSKEEENRFFDLIRQNENIPETDRGYYVGGLLEDGFWKWKSDSSYIYPRMRWALGQPNNYSGRKTCLKIYKSSYLKYTGFHSEYCDHPSSLLCQKAVNPKMPRSSEENVNEEMSTEFGKIESIYLEGTGFNDINCNAHEGFLCQKFINPKIPQSSKETTTREESEEATTKTQVVPVIEEIPTHLGVAYNYVQYDYSTEEDIEN